MGQITAFDLADLKDKYNISNYVETGTGEAVSLQYALQFEFNNYYTIDIDEDLIQRAWIVYGGLNNVNFICNLSKNALSDLMPKLSTDPTLFFLDAHFPGADFHKISYEESLRTYMNDAFPLKDEIFIIKSGRDISNDVFVIDDFSLYEEGQYDAAVWRYQWLQEELGLQTDSAFLYEAFEQTHKVQKDMRHQGYLLVTPK
jgi:hypothetical protein